MAEGATLSDNIKIYKRILSINTLGKLENYASLKHFEMILNIFILMRYIPAIIFYPLPVTTHNRIPSQYYSKLLCASLDNRVEWVQDGASNCWMSAGVMLAAYVGWLPGHDIAWPYCHKSLVCLVQQHIINNLTVTQTSLKEHNRQLKYTCILYSRTDSPSLAI